MPTDEQRALWAAIRAHPEDDTPRLVYADWLQEHGDEPRAEFIRVQCALEKLGTDRRTGRKQRPTLEAREKALLAAHRGEWLVPFFRLFAEANRSTARRWLPAGNPHNPFRRGFLILHELSLDQAGLLVGHSGSVEPVESIYAVTGGRDSSTPTLIELAGWSGAGCIYQLHCVGATDESATAITAGYFRSLSHLELTKGSVTDVGAKAIAQWPGASRLHTLTLSDNPITQDGTDALIGSPYLANLGWLYLLRTRVSAEGEQRLRDRFGYHVQVSSEVA